MQQSTSIGRHFTEVSFSEAHNLNALLWLHKLVLTEYTAAWVDLWIGMQNVANKDVFSVPFTFLSNFN